MRFGAQAYHNSPPSLRFFAEIGFEDALGGDSVQAGLETSAACARGAQGLLGIVRGQVLVHEIGAQPEAAVEALSEAARQVADRVLGAVGARGQSNDQQRGSPFRDQALDFGETRAVVRSSYRGEGMGEAGLEVADCDTDAPGAEIEREDRTGLRAIAGHEAQAWPACSDRLAKSMPSRPIAAGSRFSVGRSKITSVVA
jgi:hypothetical protein